MPSIPLDIERIAELDYEIDFCPNSNYPNTDLTDETFTISGESYFGISLEKIPKCINSDKNFFSIQETSGCCIDIELPGRNKYDTQYKVKFINDNDKLPESLQTDTVYNIYHKEPLQDKISFLQDPNRIKTFFMLIIISIFLIFILAIIASCYEFWLRYGDSIECLYYIGKCKNIGDETKSGEAWAHMRNYVLQ